MKQQTWEDKDEIIECLLKVVQKIFDDINSGNIRADSGIVVDSFTWHTMKTAIAKATD